MNASSAGPWADTDAGAVDDVVDPAAAVDGDADRWAAVQRRDPDWDGRFVFAVRTTGIYCRPSCPSRAALRANVSFFAAPAQAAAAGFRPCKRCRPDGPAPQQQRAERVAQACRALERSDAGVPLADLARAAQLSPYHFHRLFREVTGLTPKAYFKAVQARRVQAALAGAPSVTDAIYAAGFNTAGRFYEGAGAELGMAPLAYRAGGAGELIRQAIVPCALGFVLVAATPRGVCAIELGDTGALLQERLQRRFPRARLVAGDAPFQDWVAAVVAFLEHPRGLLDLPLDVQGTVFQQQVWQALRRIPSGETRSYSELAAAIGRPGAARAVARACASNSVAVAVPCHRIVRGDGALSGYRWGVARKAELLRREKA